MDDDKKINDLLNIPTETQTIEFKRLKGDAVVAKIIRTIVAFANTDGGSVIIGIDDPEKTTKSGLDRVYGIEEDADKYDEIFRELQRIIPPLTGVGRVTELKAANGKTVTIIRVPKSTNSLCSINNEVFIRLQKSNKKLTPSEIIKMSYAKGFTRADSELVDVDFDLLQTQYLDGWRKQRGISSGSIEEVLFKTGLARKDTDGVLKPTRAAVLLFAEYPTNLMDTKCAIRVMQYTGTIANYGEAPNLVGIPKTIEGPVIEVIQKAHDYVLTLLRNGIEIHSGFITRYKMPERAVKEAITNAVIHRDYFIKRDIEIRLYEDRIEVDSPGLLPYNITARNIGYVRSEGYRNDSVVKHLREFLNPPNLDQNEGVRAMRNEMESNGLYPPIYITYPTLDDSVRVVLLNEHRPGEWETIRLYLENNKYIANQKAREITNVEQRDKMSRMLSRWVKQGLLVVVRSKEGGMKATKYKLANAEELSNE